jgi:hypothetical protein
MFILNDGHDMFMLRPLLLVNCDCHLATSPLGENFDWLDKGG